MKILVICSGGMSTSLLVSKMKKIAQEQKEEIIIESGSVSDLSKNAAGCDVIMVAPQVRHRINEIKEITDKYNKATLLIEPQIYGLVDGKGALKQAIDAFKR